MAWLFGATVAIVVAVALLFMGVTWSMRNRNNRRR